jgi:CcmD family protein
MSDLTWLFIAFGAVWAGIGAYLLSVTTRQKKIEARLRELEHARRH